MKHTAPRPDGRCRALLSAIVVLGLVLATMSPGALATISEREIESSAGPEATAPPVIVRPPSEPGPASRLGALVLSPPYFLAKLLYAGTGALFGGVLLVLTLGDRDLAEAVWTESLTGDYVLEPEHLVGERALHFTVPPEEDPPNRPLATPRAG